MELNEQDIAQIEAWWAGKLSPGAKAAFEERMLQDAEFAEAVEWQKDLMRAVEAKGRQDMSQLIAGVHTQMVNHPNLKPYRPSKGGGSKIGKFLLKLLIAGGLLAGGYYLAKEMGWFEQLPEHFNLESVREIGTEQIIQQKSQTQDTVYMINGKKVTSPPEIPNDAEVEVKTETQTLTDTITKHPFK